MSIRTYFENIADAIREKDESVTTLTPAEMPDAILNLPSGGDSAKVIYNNDGTLAVYIDQTNNRLVWYFMGFTKNSSDVAIPQEIPIPQTGLIYSYSYGSDEITQNGNIGFYNGNIRSWSINLGTLIGGTFWGVVYSNGGQNQTNPYSTPPE